MTNQIWEWYYFPHTGHLGRYIQGQGCWIYTQKRPQSLHSPTFNLSRWSTTKPQDECRHATVVKCSRKKGRKYYKLDGGTWLPKTRANKKPQSNFIYTTIDMWPEDKGWALKRYNFGTENGWSLVESITKGLAISSTDGPDKDNTGACSFVKYDSKHMGAIAKGGCIVPGEAEIQSSTWSELMSIYTLLLALDALCQFHSIKNGTFHGCCDNQTAIKKTWSEVNHRTVLPQSVKILYFLTFHANVLNTNNTIISRVHCYYNKVSRLGVNVFIKLIVFCAVIFIS